MSEPVGCDDAAGNQEECQAEAKPGPSSLLRKAGQLDNQGDLCDEVHDDPKPENNLVEDGHLLHTCPAAQCACDAMQ